MKGQILKILLIVLSATLCSCSHRFMFSGLQIKENDWPCFRGDLGATGYAPEGIEPPLRLKWRFKAGTAVEVSPIIVGGKIIIGGLNGKLYAIDEQTGRAEGSYKFEGKICSAPAVGDGVLFLPLLGGKHSLLALDLAKGSLRWRKNLKEIFLSSPCVAGNRVFVGTEQGKIVALNADTGRELWSFGTEGQIHCSPTLSDSLLYFGSDDNCLYAVSIFDGRLKWQQKLDASIYSAPAIGQGYVYLGTVGGSFYCLDRLSGEARWSFTAQGGIYCSPALGVRERSTSAPLTGLSMPLPAGTGSCCGAFKPRELSGPRQC